MTTQAGEKLFYNGEEYGMFTEPLDKYLVKKKIKFLPPGSHCWRGYFGTWEIKDDKLFLIDLKAYIKGFKVTGLNDLFPQQSEVFASWFTGAIIIPLGELLDYKHQYVPVYEKTLFLSFKNGRLKSKKEIDNREEYLKDKEEGLYDNQDYLMF